MGRFDGKVVWITGGGTGIGRACALEFAREGAAVAISGRREDRLASTVAELEALGARALAVGCDVTDDASLDAAVGRVVDALGGLDVAMANAGFAVNGRVWEVPMAEWRLQIDINVLGVVSTVRAAMPELMKRQGRIALVGSVSSYVFAPKNGAYNASKAAVRAIGETLSAELAQDGSGVTCTTIHPGFVHSEIPQVRNDGSFDPSRKDRRPQQLMWQAEDAARVIVPAIHRRRRELVFTGHGKLGVAVARYAPGLLYRLLAR